MYDVSFFFKNLQYNISPFLATYITSTNITIIFITIVNIRIDGKNVLYFHAGSH